MGFAKSLIFSIFLHGLLAIVILAFPQSEIIVDNNLRESDFYKNFIEVDNTGWSCIQNRNSFCSPNSIKSDFNKSQFTLCREIFRPDLPILGCNFNQQHPEDLLNLPKECRNNFPEYIFKRDVAFPRPSDCPHVVWNVDEYLNLPRRCQPFVSIKAFENRMPQF